MAGFQSAANAVVSAPGNIGRDKAFVDVLKTQLAGEKATTDAYNTIANNTTRIAKGETLSDEELNKTRELIQKIPEPNRKAFSDAMEGVINLGKSYTSQQIKLNERTQEKVNIIKAGLQRKSMMKAATGYSREELLAGGLDKVMQGIREDMKGGIESGTTQTSR